MQDERQVQNFPHRYPIIEMPEDRLPRSIEVAAHFERLTATDEKVRTAPATMFDVSTLLTNAKRLLEHNEKELARGLILKALSLDSHHPLALRLCEQLLDPIQDLPKIVQIRETICRVDYNFATVLQLAEVHYKSGNDMKAKEKYLEALTLVVEDQAAFFEIYKNLGNILTRDRDYEGAEEYYHRAYTLQPDSDVLMVNLGTLELQKNECNTALERFRKALHLNKKNDKAWVGLALVHNQMGDKVLAIANLENAIDLNSKNRTAVHLYANWAIQEGKYVQAIEVLQNFLADIQVDEEMSLVLIQLLCQINRFDLARLEMERVLLWNPDSKPVRQIEVELKRLAQRMG